ncbi:N/A [soil metagenome]
MKILAVASGGGHWVELLRLRPAFDDHDVTYLSTNESFAKTVNGFPFYIVEDVSRWNKIKFITVGLKMLKIIKRIKPDFIITTGAAPGVLSIIIGRILNIKTVWIESMCHIEKRSLSGRIAAFFASRAYTQWPHLATKTFKYKGGVI